MNTSEKSESGKIKDMMTSIKAKFGAIFSPVQVLLKINRIRQEEKLQEDIVE